jgi:uncharacterized phage protein gp47/JayE
MANEFLKEFDTLLDAILVDYSNQDSAPDTSVGSIVYIKAACLASMLWGMYRYQDYIARQIFPDTADPENLNHHGQVYGIDRQPTDTDQTYLAKVLTFLKKPPAGGDKYDWGDWTQYDRDGNPVQYTGISGGYTGLRVLNASVYPEAQGAGTVDVVIMPSDTSYIGSTGMEELRVAADASVDDQRPVTSSAYRVLSPTLRQGPVNITVHADAGVILDTVTMVADLKAHYDGLVPGQAVYASQLSAICINDGALAATVITPSDIIPSSQELLKYTSVTVTQI